MPIAHLFFLFGIFSAYIATAAQAKVEPFTVHKKEVAGTSIAPDPGKDPDFSVLAGRIIALDPGHGGTADTDHFRVGPSGEREEWVNLRVGLMLRDLLELHGASVVLTRESDVHVELSDRAKMAMDAGAEIFISIHHNATADRAVNFPIIYFHGSAQENEPSVRLAWRLASAFSDSLFLSPGALPDALPVKEADGAANPSETGSSVTHKGIPLSIVSDYTIFPVRGAMVLRGTYGIPAIIAEASFFSNAGEESRLKLKEYNQIEAHAYLRGIALFLSESAPELVQEKQAPLQIEPFRVFEQADRMKPEALDWQDNFLQAKEILCSIDPLGSEGIDHLMWNKPLSPVSIGLQAEDLARLEQAWALFELSVKSFPDSYFARACHAGRVRILQLKGLSGEATAEQRRLSAYYPLPKP